MDKINLLVLSDDLDLRIEMKNLITDDDFAISGYSGLTAEGKTKTVNKYPEIVVDGEMQVDYALNKDLRDKTFPFNKLFGKDVNTLVFPNLSAANTVYRMMLEMGVAELIGPIQIGLNKPIHFTDCEASVRDIVNITAVAVIDAIVEKKKKQCLKNWTCLWELSFLKLEMT